MYRVGEHWGTTVIRVGELPPDRSGRRPDDELVAWVPRHPHLALRICDLLNVEEWFYGAAADQPATD